MEKDTIQNKWREIARSFVFFLISVIYVFAIPCLFAISGMSFMVFDSPHMTTGWGLFIVACCLSVPCSALFSIIYMWKKVSRKEYSKAYIGAMIPLFFLLGALSLLSL